MWSHNLLVLIQRRLTADAAPGKAASIERVADVQHPRDNNAGSADAEASIADADPSAVNGSAAVAVTFSGDSQAPAVPRCSSDHARLPWLAATIFVVSYSYLLSMSVPYFSTLVGIVASSTYLVCAYT